MHGPYRLVTTVTSSQRPKRKQNHTGSKERKAWHMRQGGGEIRYEGPLLLQVHTPNAKRERTSKMSEGLGCIRHWSRRVRMYFTLDVSLESVAENNDIYIYASTTRVMIIPLKSSVRYTHNSRDAQGCLPLICSPCKPICTLYIYTTFRVVLENHSTCSLPRT